MKNLSFAGPAQPYRLRSGEFAIVEHETEDGFVGRLLPSELQTSWDDLGRDRDGDSKYDLMEVVRPNTPDSMRFKHLVERILAAPQ